MQKKSLLVALFCGALCLTGCLKNEESDSVAQVRIAKAKELTSIADLNTAKAQAEIIYANAEATIAQAEAKLREANAALVLAQAETEKVRAELLKVQVQLMQVVVDEEKVRLQMLEADLQQKLAEVEAAVAKAEAEKAKYIKDLENYIAQAEIQAVDNAKKLLKAEAEMADYILTLEGYKAEQARAASVKYFAAIEQIQKLQTQKIQTQATKALVEAGAKEIRTVIYDVIDNIDEEIAEKEALVEYLKEYQTMTPEQIEVAMAAARVQLEEYYNAYQDAVTAEKDAQTLYNNLAAKQSLFQKDWTKDSKSFVNYVTNNWGDYFTQSWWGWYEWTYFVSYVESVNFVDYEDYAAVPYYGYADPADATKFIKLWKYEPAILTRDVRYPDVTVAKTFNYEVQEGVIAPAEIFYENVDVVLDSILKRKEAQIAKEVKAAQKESADNVEEWQNTIEDNKAVLKLHQEYVDKRQDTITKYESDLAKLVDEYNKSQAGHATALEKYLHYMVMNYEVPTSYFEAEIVAAKDTVKASSEYTSAYNAWSDKKGVLETTLTTNKKTAHDNDSIAKVEYETAKTVAGKLWAAGNYDETFWTAANQWSPFFAGSYKKVSTMGDEEPYYYSYKKRDAGHKGTIEHITNPIDTTGLSQLDWLKAKGREEVARLNWEAKKAAYQIDSTTTPKSQVDQAKKDYDDAVAFSESTYLAMEGERGKFVGQQNVYEYVWGRVAEAEKAWNKDFANDTYKTLDYDGKWYKLDVNKKKVYAGTAQNDKFMADSLWDAANHQVNGHGTTAKDSTLLDFKTARQQKYTTKKEAWGLKFDALVKALNTTEKDYKADPEVAKLYAETLKPTEATTKYVNKWNQLRKLYGLDKNDEGVYINYIAPEEPAKYVDPSYFSTNYNAPLGFSWVNSNFNLNPEFEYISNVAPDQKTGKVVITKSTVAELLYGSKEGAEYSLTSINAGLAKDIADEPERLKGEIAEIEGGLKGTAQDVADVRAALKQYKAYESDYKAWVSEREAAFKAWNEAKKVRIDAKIAYEETKEVYDALKIAANGCMWVYDPNAELYVKVYPNDPKPTAGVDVKGKWEDGFTKVNVNDAIEVIENGSKDLKDVVTGLKSVVKEVVKDTKDLRLDDKDIDKIIDKIEKVKVAKGAFDNIAGLNFMKKVLQEVLTQGKVVLQTVLEAFDAEIAELEEKIELQTKLAEIYKAIMNGYLGIVDDEADDEE